MMNRYVLPIVLIAFISCCTIGAFGQWSMDIFPADERSDQPRATIGYGFVENGFATFGEALEELKKKGEVQWLTQVGLVHFHVYDPVFQKEVLTELGKIAPQQLAEAKGSAGNMHNPKVTALRKPFGQAVLATPTVQNINAELAPFGLCVAGANAGEKFQFSREQDRLHFKCIPWLAIGKDSGLAIVAAARSQIGKTTEYDPTYTRLAYPMGDVPIEKGVCTDVVVRALRDALKMDLQQLMHEDMTAAFSVYPDNWGLAKPDRNIDHRRVPNMKKFFVRKGFSLPVSKKPDAYLPGDLVTCTVNGSLPHIMVVSDRKTPENVPLVIHNIGQGAREENRLFAYPLNGHYRTK